MNVFKTYNRCPFDNYFINCFMDQNNDFRQFFEPLITYIVFRKGLPNETQCYSLVNLTPSGLFRILHIE